MTTTYRHLMVLAVVSALAARDAQVTAAPMYGAERGDRGNLDHVGRRCLANGYHPFTPGTPLTLTVFMDSSFAADWAGWYPPASSSPLTQDQAESVLQDAFETWNRESRGPLFLWGGRLDFSAQLGPLDDKGNLAHVVASCAYPNDRLPERSVLVYLDRDPQNDPPGGIHTGFAVAGAGGLDGCDTPGRTAIAVRTAKNGAGQPRSATFHNLKALFVHELGHALGLTHSNGRVQAGDCETDADCSTKSGCQGGRCVCNTDRKQCVAPGSSGAISVMSENSTWTNFFREVFPRDRGTDDRRPVGERSASPDGTYEKSPLRFALRRVRWYTQAAPYPEGLAGIGPDGTGELTTAETGNKLRTNRLGQIHLWPYDLDCVDDALSVAGTDGYQDGRRRRLRYIADVYRPGLNSFRGAQNAGPEGPRTSKGLRSGGHPRSVGGDRMYALFYDHLGLPERLVTDPSLSGAGAFVRSQTFFVAGDSMGEVSLPVVAFSAHEKSSGFHTVTLHAAANRVDVSARSDPNDAAAQVDPPIWRQRRGDSPANLGKGEDLHFLMAPGDARLVQTHIPPAVAWDPVGGRTLFVTVPTRGNCATEGTPPTLICGQIYIHPGYAAIDDHTLQSPVALKVTPPEYAGTGSYSYTGRTDVAPAVTCAPYPHGMSKRNNCLLAWVDSGTPDGHVLYTYFSVAGSGVAFQGTASVLGVVSRSDLSAAYVDGRFWLGYKSAALGEHDRASLVSTFFQDLGRWGEVRRSFPGARAAEPPTWLYDPINEHAPAAFVYTTYD